MHVAITACMYRKPQYFDEILTAVLVCSPQIAEWVIGAWLSHQHHFPRYQEQMKTGYWEPPLTAKVQDSTRARM
jgi:phosphoglycerate dehydrogenase-like enzyme